MLGRSRKVLGVRVWASFLCVCYARVMSDFLGICYHLWAHGHQGGDILAIRVSQLTADVPLMVWRLQVTDSSSAPTCAAGARLIPLHLVVVGDLSGQRAIDYQCSEGRLKNLKRHVEFDF